MEYLIIYLLAVNLFGFLLMRSDKRKAKRHEWRIPEAYLFLCALACGSLGVWIGMYLLRHKTKHLKFIVGIPAILVLQLYAFYRLGFQMK